ncbi:MAG: shikimate kinase [Candidatus Omnitrophica bacterium]|nr:shikimate kinase [Candidatus Omnitrophota bacterium]
MKNVYLVGFMGTGKTAVGKLISRKLHREFIETDALIEEGSGKKITEIFEQYGEVHFRKLERKLLEKLATKTNLIVSCGGGLICNPENLKLMAKSGIIICLKAKPDTIYRRTKQASHRPLLNVKNPLSAIENLLNLREEFYSQAHYCINTDDILPDEVAAEVIKVIDSKV